MLRAARLFNRLRHLRKDIDICAAKPVDRLFAIADDEQVRARVQRELVHQIALQAVSILKFIDQKEPITFRDAGEYLGMRIQEFQRAQLQIVKIKR